MKFKATTEQILEMAAEVTNRSKPIKMGPPYYQPYKIFHANDFEIQKDCKGRDTIRLFYVKGRMVKFRVSKVRDDIWQADSYTATPTVSCQTWVSTYPTFKDLLKAMGLKEIKDEI